MRATLLLLACCATVSAQTQNQDDLTKINAQMQALAVKLEQDKTKFDASQKDLQTTDLAVNAINKRLTQINQQLKQQQKNLAALKIQQQQYAVELSSQQQELNQQMRAAYILSQQTPAKLLLNEQDPAEFSRMMHYYQAMNRARVDLMQSIDTTLSNIITNTQQIEMQTQQLQQLQNEQTERRQELLETKATQQNLIRLINASIQSKQAQLNQLASNKKALTNVLTRIQSQPAATSATVSSSVSFNVPKVPFANLKGRLPWPTQGKITQTFSSHIANSTDIPLSAIVITAPAGQGVYAVAPGRVVFSNWLRGLGMLLIVDQGNGYLTLYGYNQSLYKNVGDVVKPGDLIATVGNSGGQQQAGLYFGIRKNTTALDPSTWLSPK